MDTTNKRFTLNDRSPAQIEEAINSVLLLAYPKEDQFELPEAILLGFSFGKEVDFDCIDSAGNVYELLDNQVNKIKASLFDAVAVVTCGWAAPLGPADDIAEMPAPSESPNRTRVRLTLIAKEEGICSTIRFANSSDDVGIEEGGQGPLGDAFAAFWASRILHSSK
jgi:hypothetical protein